MDFVNKTPTEEENITIVEDDPSASQRTPDKDFNWFLKNELKFRRECYSHSMCGKEFVLVNR